MTIQTAIDTIVFDLGGVLIDLDVARCIGRFRQLMGADQVRDILGIDEDGEGVAAVSAATQQLMHEYEYGYIATQEFLSRVLSSCYPGTTREQVGEAWMSMLDGLPQPRLDYISKLRQSGYKTILLSNSNSMHWDAICAQYHLEQYFDSMFASHLLHMAKPHREIYEYVSRESGIDGRSTVYVDDLEKNRAAGERYMNWRTCGSIEQLQRLLR